MKVAYVTIYDAHDPRQWSGTGYNIARALEGQGVTITYIGPLADDGGRAVAAKRLLHRVAGNRRFLRERDAAVVNGYASQVRSQLAGHDIDVVLSPGTIAIASLDTTIPIVFWTDATFSQMVDLYPEFTGLAAASIEAGNSLETRALANAALAIYASGWAARSAIDDYGVEPGKVCVIPFGANIDSERDLAAIEAITAARPLDVCQLLFIGVDWHRKGGDISLEVVSALRKSGIEVHLTIVGSSPDIPDELRDCVTVRGFMDKSTELGRREFDRLFEQSHFLLMPSRAECFGIVFCEASSFGLPSIASNVGGIPAAVAEGKNGHVFSLEHFIAGATAKISQLWHQRAAYERLCMDSFAEYQQRLNWDRAGAACVAQLKSVVAARERIDVTPLVTVITVVYNGARHIEETIRAVAAQTYSNLRYLVVDGGSSDGTVQIIERCAHLIDEWVSEPDAGLYDAMNKAVGMVSDPSSYIIFAHADDTLHSPDAIERIVALGRGADLVYGRMLFVDQGMSGTMGREVELADLAQETLCHPATLVRRHVFDSVGFFDTSLRVAADYDHIVRCFARPVSTRFADVIVTRMRMGGLSGSAFVVSCRERKKVVRRYFTGMARLAGVAQVNFYDIPRNTARHWLDRAGLLGHWRALKRS